MKKIVHIFLQLFLFFVFAISCSSKLKNKDKEKDEVKKQLEKLIPSMVDCYKQGKWFIPRAEFSQEMVLRFVVRLDGIPEKITIENGTSVPFPIQECVKNIVSHGIFTSAQLSEASLVTAFFSISSEPSIK
jgi:hypothetical protein